MSFGNDLLTGLLKPDNLRDYRHASLVYRSDNYAKLPKTRHWFYVYFELTTEARERIINLEDAATYRLFPAGSDYTTIGILVKSISLPQFSFDTQKHNQYNRWALNVKKINYDPISIVFHDDALNFVRSLWYSYYWYMIGDSRASQWGSTAGLPVPDSWRQNSYSIDNLSYSSLYYPDSDDLNDLDNFHCGLDTVPRFDPTAELDRVSPFFKSIRIYHFSRQSGEKIQDAMHTEYVLVNPIIKSFGHSQLERAGFELAEHSMSIEYEAVLYNGGPVSDAIPGWDILRSTMMEDPYKVSPIRSPQASIFGVGGVLGTLGNISSALGSGNPIAAGLLAAKQVVSFKSPGQALNSLESEGINLLKTNLSTLSSGKKSIVVPNVSNANGKTVSIGNGKLSIPKFW